MKGIKNILLIILFAAIIVVVVFLFSSPKRSSEKKISAAVIAGFMIPFQEIASEFENKTGIKILTSYSSAGKFYAQAINGAPYDIILADEERSLRLYNEGFADKPFIYARGEVVLWSISRDFIGNGNWKEAVRRNNTRKIAIVNPDVGIYGAAARKALEDTGLWKSVHPTLVYTPDLAQVFQYAFTESVDAGFCALAQAFTDKGKKGYYCIINEAPEIIHSGCVLNSALNRDDALRFAEFLVSPEAEKIKKKFGYK